ncbi:MAG: nickel pincer cofactor biosynthesis protein LarC [Desulfobacteraceae bacterium]|nr:nickel pincer cofactor biosynthesis protein LarC [Desulfobacteraceae bacterium]
MLAYLDCFSGISGNMILGAFIDLGIDPGWLKKALSPLGLKSFTLKTDRVSRNGIGAIHVEVDAKADTKSRNYSDIQRIIDASNLSGFVKKKSLDTFDRLAAAESKIHQCAKEKVHFHEVGGIDAIVDIVGTALCFENLGISGVAASTIPLGTGLTTCRHGVIPIPAPATLELLASVPTYGTDVPHELVTPTGAAILRTWVQSFGPMPVMKIRNTGYGAGTREHPDRPNLLRMLTGDAAEKTAVENSETVVEMVTAIDDMNPEIFGYLMEQLFGDGALDVLWSPVFMKKNRPGTMIHVVCREADTRKLVHRILTETSTLGVRFQTMQRVALPRKTVDVNTSYGRVKGKQITRMDGSVRILPEYEECRRIALETGKPLAAIYEELSFAFSDGGDHRPDDESAP